jgi:transposase-like protein
MYALAQDWSQKMPSVLKEDYFHDEQAAFAMLESIMWPEGPICPHCKATDRLNRLAPQKTKPSKKHPQGKPVYGLWKCYHCRKQFTVRKGTVFEESHLALHQWFQATFLMCSSKKGISANQLHRTLGCTLKTAWFVAMRLREAMTPSPSSPLGGEGKILEADETYMGKRKGRTSGKSVFVSGFGWVSPPPRENFRKVVTLVERGGSARSFHVEKANKRTVRKILLENADRASELMTDESGIYPAVGAHFAAHHTVNHSADEYVRDYAHTNTIEGFFSIFKRGMTGVYQHCSERHLHRYLAEFDFRYSNRIALGVNDGSRTARMLQGAKGKRLTYR